MNDVKTVSYSSTRREVWRFYWRAWARPAGLWIVHVLLGLLIAIARSPPTASSPAAFLLSWLASTLVCVLVSSSLPLVLFKPQRRLLTIDETGWTTEIGKRRGSRTWAQIRAVEDDGDAITIVGANGNAMIVPRRAFADDAERSDFLERARRWHASATAR